MSAAPYDPRGLIAEAYKIEGISLEEARTIFFDWALSRADAPSAAEQIAALLEALGADEAHPMTRVLREGLAGEAAPRGRRGGARGRRL